MVRRSSRVIEELEERALLSSLAYRLTTDQPVYRVGQPINLTFTETKTSDQPVTVEVSPTDFTISQNNAAIWQSDPADANKPPASETLLPGQSVSQTASWDGIWSFPQPSGQSTPTSVPINGFGTFVVSNPNAPAGLSATFQITDPISSSLTTSESAYQLGEPIQFTFAMVNTSDQPITILADWPPSFNITHNGTVVDATPDLEWFDPITIAAGQTYSNEQTWDGIPDQGPYAASDLTGSFTATCGPFDVPNQFSTTFQIEAPPAGSLVTSVATNQVTYDSGQPVSLTFTETNDGDRPVSVLAGSTDFEISGTEMAVELLVSPNGVIDWTTLDRAPTLAQTWLTLEPGQSYSQTATWNGTGGVAGSFTVSNLIDSSGSSTTFQIVSTPAPTQSTQDPAPSTVTTSSTLVAATLSTDHDAYKLGQSVRVSLIVKDISASKVTVTQKQSVETLTVQRGSTVVYESARKARVANSEIKPGHPLKLTALWSGNANQAGVKKLTAGTYTITVDDDGYAASTAIQLVSRKGSGLR